MSTGILITYDNGNRVPDVMAMVLALSPTETPMLSGFRKTTASNTLHEWQVQTNDVQNDNATIEGASFGTALSEVPTRPNNVTQIFTKDYGVTSTEQAVKSYHNDKGKAFAYQMTQAMRRIGTDIELALVRGSIATGNNSTARRLAGLQNFITTNATTVSSGTKLTESLYNDTLQLIYDINGDDIGAPVGTIDEVYVNSRLKRVISSFTAGNERNIAADDKRLINSVDTYESDFGRQSIFMSRYISSTTNSDATVLFIGREQNAVSLLEPVKNLPQSEVAQTGHSKKGAIRGELTLETNEAWQGRITGLDTSFN